MKRIEAFIQPHRLNKVVSALHALPRFPGFSVFHAHGQGQGHGTGGHYAYDEGGLLFHEHRALVVFCEDTEAPLVASEIAKAAHTGQHGDGIVVISDVTNLLRIRDVGSAP
jgi:nitrogen regulatory protein P-II 1